MDSQKNIFDNVSKISIIGGFGSGKSIRIVTGKSHKIDKIIIR